MRAADMSLRTYLSTASVWIALLALSLAPGFTAATGLTTWECLAIVVPHATMMGVNILFLRKLADEHPAVGAWYAWVPTLNVALTCAFVVFTGDPASFGWVFYFLYITVMATSFEPHPLLPALAAAGPLGAAWALHAQGADSVAVPLAFTLAGPGLYAALALPSHRARRARREAERLGRLARVAAAEQERLVLVARVGETLRARLATAERSASEALTLAQAHPPSAAASTSEAVARVREALRELRAAVWALDPTDAPWAVVGPHLRRIASEVAGEGALEADVPPELLVPPADRLALLAAARTASAGSRVRVHADAGRLRFDVTHAPHADLP
jgi:signal transduction histidine kinase